MATASTTFAGSENPLSEGGVWVTPTGVSSTVQKVAGAARATAVGADALARYVGTTFGSNQYSKTVIINVANADGDPVTRLASNTDGDCYGIAADAAPSVSIFRIDDNGATLTFNTLGATFTLTVADTDTLALQSVGNSHVLRYNDRWILQRTDATYSGGQPGIDCWYAAGALDGCTDWEGGDVTYPVIDTSVESVRTGTGSPQTWSHTAASSGVKGVVVCINHGTSSTDHISAVTYGGVAMSRIQRNTDTATEPGASEIWFLGSSIPQGTQTVSATCGATTDDIQFVSISFLASADLEVIDFDGISENIANPSVTLQYTGRTAIAICTIYSGLGTVTNLTELTGVGRLHDHDYGNFISVVSVQNFAGSSDFTIGHSSGGTSDDVAFSAIAIAEVAIGGNEDPLGLRGIFGI